MNKYYKSQQIPRLLHSDTEVAQQHAL